MLVASISPTVLISVAVFIAMAAAAWLVLEWLSPDKGRAEERLDELRDPSLRREDQSNNTVSKVLENAAPRLAKPLQPKTELEASKIKLKLCHAGFRGENAPTTFLGMKFLGLVLGFFLGGGAAVLTSGIGRDSLFASIGIAGLMFYLPNIIVWWLGRRRKESIFLALPDALDLMVVCVEAGLALDQAMRKVSEEMKKTYRVIADEFGLCNLQMQMGRPRNHVLQELGHRSGVEDLQQLASILIQADKFGSSIAKALRVQSDSMRTRRQQIAEEKAAKTAVKLIFPLVLFIFPGIFVVLVGPAAITMIREMLPAMAASGG